MVYVSTAKHPRFGTYGVPNDYRSGTGHLENLQYKAYINKYMKRFLRNLIIWQFRSGSTTSFEWEKWASFVQSLILVINDI